MAEFDGKSRVDRRVLLVLVRALPEDAVTMLINRVSQCCLCLSAVAQRLLL